MKLNDECCKMSVYIDKDLEAFLNSLGVLYYKNVNLKKYCTFKIGGNASYLIEVENETSLIDILNYLYINNLRYKIVGHGSNLLFSDNGYKGVIIVTKAYNNVEIKEDVFICESGASLPKLCTLSIKHGLTGLESFRMIPATLGGAICMNAGTPESEIFDRLLDITYFENGEIFTKQKEYCNFCYRNSEFNYGQRVVLKAALKLNFSDKTQVQKAVNENIKKRRLSQPYEYYNAGSIFKRDGSIMPAKLIDDAGLKGTRVGGAMVSAKHSGFIINDGSASARDVLQLIDYIKFEVNKKYSVLLNEEIEYIGEED